MSENSNTVTVTFDLDEVATRVRSYYDEMQEGQIAEMFGETGKAFTQAKKVIGLMAGILDYVVGPENVGRVNDIVFNVAVSDTEEAEGVEA